MGERPRVTSPGREMEILGKARQGSRGDREGPQGLVEMKLQHKIMDPGGFCCSLRKAKRD